MPGQAGKVLARAALAVPKRTCLRLGENLDSFDISLSSMTAPTAAIDTKIPPGNFVLFFLLQSRLTYVTRIPSGMR
jgi:hypothetical protein